MRTNEKTSLAGLVSSENTFSIDSAANVAKFQPIKPEIDLLSWSKLGSNAKPFRERQQKRRGGR